MRFLLTDLIRAWDTSGLIDGKKKSIVVFLAVNAAMRMHPITADQVRVLEEDWGIHVDGKDVKKQDEPASQGWFEVFRPIEVRKAIPLYS